MIGSMQQNNSNPSVQFGWRPGKKATIALGVAPFLTYGGGFVSGWFGKPAANAADKLLKSTQDLAVYLKSDPGEVTIPSYHVTADSPTNFYGQFANLDPKTTKVVYRPFFDGKASDWEPLGTIDIPGKVAKDMQGKVKGSFGANSKSIVDPNGKLLYSFSHINDDLVYSPANGPMAFPFVTLVNSTSNSTKTRFKTGADALRAQAEGEAALITQDWPMLIPSLFDVSVPSTSSKVKRDVIPSSSGANSTQKLTLKRPKAVEKTAGSRRMVKKRNTSSTQANSDAKADNPFSRAANSTRVETETTRRRLSPVERRAQKN